MSTSDESGDFGSTAEFAEDANLKTGMNESIDAFENPRAAAILPLVFDDLGIMEVDDEYGLQNREGGKYGGSGGVDGSSSQSIDRQQTALRRLTFSCGASTISSTRSLDESDLGYQLENGRRYVPGYYMPNDEEEQLRMQIIHQGFLFHFNNKLTSVSLHNPCRVLDIGTGTGEWAIGMAEAFSNAEVTGIDLSAIQPSSVPSNVFFEIYDAEDDGGWTYPSTFFDFIHFRCMKGCFRSWDEMYERTYMHLKPGGWIEVIDFDDQFKFLKNYFQAVPDVERWYKSLKEAMRKSGKDFSPMHLQPEKLINAGFVDVSVTTHEFPMHVWLSDPNEKSSAKLWLTACLAGFEAMSLRPLSQDLGWDAEKVRRLCEMIIEEVKSIASDKEKGRCLTASVKIMVGRIPFDWERTGKHSVMVGSHEKEAIEWQPEGKRMRLEHAMSREERIVKWYCRLSSTLDD